MVYTYHLVWDMVIENIISLDIKEFEETNNVKTNILEHGAFSVKIKEFLYWKAKPLSNHVAPTNCLLNIISSLDIKEVTHIYKLFAGRNRGV